MLSSIIQTDNLNQHECSQPLDRHWLMLNKEKVMFKCGRLTWIDFISFHCIHFFGRTQEDSINGIIIDKYTGPRVNRIRRRIWIELIYFDYYFNVLLGSLKNHCSPHVVNDISIRQRYLKCIERGAFFNERYYPLVQVVNNGFFLLLKYSSRESEVGTQHWWYVGFPKVFLGSVWVWFNIL